MPAIHLFDNTTLGWEPVDLGTDQTVGTRFTTTTAGWINRLRFKRHTAGHPPDAPQRLALYRVSDGAKLADVIPDDSGAADWQDTILVPSVAVATGTTYCVAAYFTNGTRRWQGAWSGAGTPPAPLAFGNPHSVYVNATGLTHPTTDPGAYAFPVDVAFDTAAENPAGTGDPTKTGDLVDWFDPTSATKPTGNAKLYPDTILGLHSKISLDGITWDAKLGPLQSYGSVGDKGVSAGVEIVRTAVADVRANLPSTAGLATTAQVNAARDAVNTHTDAVQANLEAAIDAAADAVNAHTDDAVVTLQGDLNDRRDQINAHTDAVQAELDARIDAHDTAVQGAITTARDAVNTHTDGVKSDLVAAIDAHDTGVKAAITTARTTLTAAIDAAVADLKAYSDLSFAGLRQDVMSAFTVTNQHIDAAITAINDHTDVAELALHDQIEAHDDAVQAAIVAARNAVNDHTDVQAGAINANTDANVNGLGILLSAEHATLTATLTGEHAAISALITGANGLAAALISIAADIITVVSTLSGVWLLLRRLAGGGGTFTLAGEADFAASPYLFAQAGDYYEVDLTAWPLRQGAIAFPVGQWLPHLGWVVPLYGTAYGKRENLTFSSQRFLVGPGATGLLIYSKAGVQGHARAYQAT